VLLLDEPFGALDANVRRELRRWLREIHDELGITTLFVTHDQEEALDLADRVVILDHGRIVQEGSPQEVCRRPASAFVTRFLGDTNRLEAQVRGGVARIADGSIAADGIPDGHAEIYARPADLEWTGEGAGLSARILRVLDRPDSRRLVARLDDGETVELDVTPETVVSVGDQGAVKLRRANVFSLA
jgi:sulfate transport system ATP-binding protein